VCRREEAAGVLVSIHTVRAIEAGKAGTAAGSFIQALWVLGLIETLSSVADPNLHADVTDIPRRHPLLHSSHVRAGRDSSHDRTPRMPELVVWRVR
jgi:hypothetical protein